MKSILDPEIAESIHETEVPDANPTRPAASVADQPSADAIRFLRDGINAAKDENRTQARYFLLESLRLDERSETAWLWLASVSEQPAELLGFLQQVLNINPNNERAREWETATRRLLANSVLTRGAAHIGENQRAAAADCFRQAIELAPENETAWLWLAAATDRAPERLSYLERVLNLNPHNEKALAAVCATKRQMAGALLREGGAAALAGERERAENCLREAIEFDGEAAEIWILKAYLADSLEEKSDYFRRALEIDPNQTEAAAGLAALAPTVEEQPEQAAEPEPETAPRIAPVEDELLRCPFCQANNAAHAARCVSCKAFVTIGEPEQMLGGDAIDDASVREFVERLNAEQSARELSAAELCNFGLAYLNLKNFKKARASFEQFQQRETADEATKRSVAALLEKLNENAVQNGGASSGGGKTIMVVDDSATARKLIAGKLEKHGHRVVCAVDGADALAKLEENNPDLILLDVTLPDLDGYQICKRIRSSAALKEVPVVLISGKDGFMDKMRGRMAGSTGYLIKPFGPETLLQTIESYC